jgi:hypothetical protein
MGLRPKPRAAPLGLEDSTLAPAKTRPRLQHVCGPELLLASHRRMRAPGGQLRALRAALLIAWSGLATGCGSKKPPVPPPPPIPLHLEPACDLAPSAGLSWIVEAKPRAIAEIPELIPAIALVLPEDRLQMFTASHGGIDLRQTKDLCVARYKDSLLSIARVPLDGEKVAASFESRTAKPAPRTLLAPNPRVLKMTGEVDGEPQHLLIFGNEAAAIEQGKPGPLRAVEAFAFGKLKRAAPALRGVALLKAAEVLGDTPVRVFAPGPFEGETANGLGGLLRAATAVAGSARWTGTASNIAMRIAVIGAWGNDAAAASERLGAAAHVLAESPTGHLFGLHHPIQGPVVRADGDALILDVTVDGAALARGLHDAVDADVMEMMRK